MFRLPRSLVPSLAVSLTGLGLLSSGSSARCESEAFASTGSSASTALYRPSFTERTIGNYENRLRKYSNPQRVFEYFASVEMDGNFFMTPDDLARAVTPYTFRPGAQLASKNYKYNVKVLSKRVPKQVQDQYLHMVRELVLANESGTPSSAPPSASTKKQIQKDIQRLLAFRHEHEIDFQTHLLLLRQLELTNADFEAFVASHGGPTRGKSFFDLVDADGDGLISYSEFMFFNTLLSIPERQFELAFKMVDTDGNGTLDHREFKQIMDLMRQRTPAGRQDRTLTDEEAPVFKHLFGPFGTESLSYPRFVEFRRDLKREILRIQFEQFDVDGNKTLSPTEFAMFLVSHVNQTEINKWVDRVGRLDKLQGEISFEEFMNFAVFLEHLDEMKVAIGLVMMHDKGIDKKQFERASRAALRGNNEKFITPLQIDILFELFDIDGDHHLSVSEFIHVMQKRRDGGFTERRDIGVLDFLERIKNCIESVA